MVIVRIVNIRVKVKDSVSVKGSGLGLGLGSVLRLMFVIVNSVRVRMGTINNTKQSSAHAVHTNCYNFVVASHYHLTL